MKKIILASSSPRRIEMMKENSIIPTVMPADVDESIPSNISVESTVMFLALKKALAVENQCKKGSVIVAADTIVYKDRIMGKPENKDQAFEMLSTLRNTWHSVITGVALIEPQSSRRTAFCDITKVYFKDYSNKDLWEYVNTPEPYDKAGGYAIQGTFARYTDHIDGSLRNVIGFPWEKFSEKIKLFE